MYNDILDQWSKELSVYKVKNVKIDIERLKNEFETNILKNHDPAWQETYSLKKDIIRTAEIEKSKDYTFGGWSLMANGNSYKDGWKPDGYLPAYNLNLPTVNADDFHVKTDLCTGIFDEIADLLELLDFRPRRMRISISKPYNHIKWHLDSEDTSKLITRLHIPIITNDSVSFYTENERYHFPADGSLYIINTNHLHKVENFKNVRFHILTDVTISRKNAFLLEKFMPVEVDNFYKKDDPTNSLEKLVIAD